MKKNELILCVVSAMVGYTILKWYDEYKVRKSIKDGLNQYRNDYKPNY